MENYFFLSTGKLYFPDNTVHTLEETNTVYSSVKLINFKVKHVLSLLKLKRNPPKTPQKTKTWLCFDKQTKLE